MNYLVPVDAELATAAALDFETVRLDLVQRTMERETKTNILFLDACRNNPFARSLARALGTRSVDIGRGLAPVESRAGRSSASRRSPATSRRTAQGGIRPIPGPLANAIGAPGEDILSVLTAVRNEVLAATNEKQVPWENHALRAKFYFNPAAPAAPPAFSEAAEAWRAVEHSDSEAVLELFIKRFGQTVFADLARARLAEVRPKIAAAKPAAPAPEPATAMQYEDAEQRLIRTFSGRTGVVRSVAFSPDGRTAFAGDCDEIYLSCRNVWLHLWDVSSGVELRSFTGHMYSVTSVVFSPDGRTALSGSDDRNLRLWDIASGHELQIHGTYRQGHFDSHFTRWPLRAFGQ